MLNYFITGCTFLIDGSIYSDYEYESDRDVKIVIENEIFESRVYLHVEVLKEIEASGKSEARLRQCEVCGQFCVGKRHNKKLCKRISDEFKTQEVIEG